MIHVGDITKLHGEDIEPVDVITFGSPCQDLSAAGQRAGLYGEKSSLFLDAVRVISEMRRATNGRYPRYAIWENVPGAFSSNAGSDFRDVLEKLYNENTFEYNGIAVLLKSVPSDPAPDFQNSVFPGNDTDIRLSPGGWAHRESPGVRPGILSKSRLVFYGTLPNFL